MAKNSFYIDSKINLSRIIDSAINEFDAIRASDKEQRRKTDDEKRLALKIKRQMREDGRKKEESKIKLTTYNRYLTKVRNAISSTTHKHHSFNKSVAAAAKKSKAYSERICALCDMTIAQATKEIKAIIADVKKEKAAKNKPLIEALSNMQVAPVLLIALAMSHEDKLELDESKEKAITKKQSKLIKLDASKVTEMIAYCLASKDVRALALGVALATGRRQIEVLIQGEFKEIKGGKFEFTGQAKERVKDGEKIKVKITPLADAKLITSALETIRSSQEIANIKSAMEKETKAYGKNELFNNSSRAFNLEANAIFYKFLGRKAGTTKTAFNEFGWTFKDSRAIFARMSYDKYKTEAINNNTDLMDDSLYFSDVLGHTDTDAQRSYRAFVILGEIAKVDSKSIEQLKGKEAAAVALSASARLKKIKKLAKSEAASEYDDIFKKLIAELTLTPEIKITTGFLRTKIKGRATRLSEALALIKENNLTDIK